MREHLAGQRRDLHDTLNLIAPEFNPERRLLISRLNLQGVTSNTESASREIIVVSFILHIHQTSDDLVSIISLALLNTEGKAAILLRFSQAVDAGDRGNDDHISPCEERPGSGVPQLLDLLIYVGFFLNVKVGAGI
jgi:hypothetical protein